LPGVGWDDPKESGAQVAEALAVALAIALSPFPVVPAILLLFTARPRATSLAHPAAWVDSIAAATTAFVLVSEVVDATTSSPVWLSWVRIVAGAALVGYGVREWVSRNSSHELPGWMRSIQDATH
jgi:hypothetical protein